jgi:beta-glucosidase
VGTKSRPIRELKAIDKITIAPGQTRRVSLRVPVDTLGFHLDDGRYVVETGAFRIYVGGSSRADLSASFDLEDN